MGGSLRVSPLRHASLFPAHIKEPSLRLLTFSEFACKTDTSSKPRTAAWAWWLEHRFIDRHVTRGNPDDTNNEAALNEHKDGPCIVFGFIPEGKPCRAQYVERTEALSLDLDYGTVEQLQQVADVLRPFAYARYTTHKHGSIVAGGNPRWRFVIPLAE